MTVEAYVQFSLIPCSLLHTTHIVTRVNTVNYPFSVMHTVIMKTTHWFFCFFLLLNIHPLAFFKGTFCTSRMLFSDWLFCYEHIWVQNLWIDLFLWVENEHLPQICAYRTPCSSKLIPKLLVLKSKSAPILTPSPFGFLLMKPPKPSFKVFQGIFLTGPIRDKG